MLETSNNGERSFSCVSKSHQTTFSPLRWRTPLGNIKSQTVGVPVRAQGDFLSRLKRRWSFVFLFLCATVSLQAQGETTSAALVELYDLAVQSGEHGQYDKAISLCDKAISQFGQGALDKYGPVFGHFYYIKGMMFLRKKEYQSAIEPLRTCYENWDNSSLKGIPPEGEEPKLPNRFHIHSLMQWGNALMALKNYAGAAEKLETTLLKDPKTEPRIDRLVVSLNLARCYILGGEPKKGKDFLVKVIDNGTVGPSGQRLLFMVLAWDWSPDQPFAEVRDVITTRASVTTDDSLLSRAERNPRFNALAAKAMENGDLLRALMWYSLMAHPEEVIAQYQADKERFTARREIAVKEKESAVVQRADELLAETQEKIEEIRQQWSDLLLGTGGAHYQLSSIAGARAAYRIHAKSFPNHKENPTVLHNLVVSDVNLEFWREAYDYGIEFFEKYPEHPLKPSVARVLVEVIYLQGEYAEAYKICHEVLPGMEQGSEVREIPEFVVGACSFHLNKFEEAEAHLEGYFKNYPKPKREEPARFYLGSTKVNLAKWEEAAVILEDFLADYPSSPLRPPALFLSGLSHLVLEKNEKALERISELQANFPNADEIPASHNVKADILAALEEPFEIVEPGYLTALRMVEEDGRGNNEVAAYALRQLVSANAEAEEWEKSAGHFAQFKERYWDSSYQIDTALAVLDPLVELDRRQEGLDMLVEFVNNAADAGNQPAQVDLLFGSYLDYLDKNYTTDEKLAFLDDFPFTNPSNPPGSLDAWLVMAKIETLEGSEKPAEHEDAINTLFYKLEALYRRNGLDLSSYTLVRIARWNWETNGREDDARKIYEYILNERPDTTGDAMGYALVDLGKLEAKSDADSIRERALGRFQRVIAEVENSGLREEATLGSARILSELKKWPEAEENWKAYITERNWSKARAEANYNRALCMDMQGNPAEALKVYVSVYVNFAGHLDWSTRAYLRTATILHENGKEADSLRVLQEMLKRMGHHQHPGVEIAKSQFIKWRDEFVANQQ